MAKQPLIQEADSQLVRSLAQADAQGNVISVYLNLDPSEEFALASARDTQVNSVVNEAANQIEQLSPSEERVTLRDDLKSVDWLLSDLGRWGQGAASVAVFCSSERDLFCAAKLASPVDTSVAIKETPRFVPMLEDLRGGRWCVLLVDRSGASVYLGSPGRLMLVDESDDDVRGQHDNGGFSQGRFERSVEEEVEDHLERVAQMIFDLHRQEGFDYLTVGATEELAHRMLSHLHPYIAELTTDRIAVDVENVSLPELEQAVTDLAERIEQERETRLLERLRYELGSGGRGVAGLGPVLDALNDASAETLMIERGFDAPGARCPNCGYLADGGGRCPVDGEDLRSLQSIVDGSIERAVELSAGVKVLPRTELADLGHVAAVLRFDPGA